MYRATNAGDDEITAGEWVEVADANKLNAVGGSYDSAASGARVRIFPDADTGIQVIDDAAADVFKTIVGGTHVGDVIIGNYSGGQGIFYDKSAGVTTLKGGLAVSYLTAGSITSKAITLAVSAGAGDSKIQAGKTDFGDNTNGFILGIDDSDSDKAKFEIGNAYNYLKWSGDYMKQLGLLQLGMYSFIGSFNDGMTESETGAGSITRALLTTDLIAGATEGSLMRMYSPSSFAGSADYANTFGGNIKFSCSVGTSGWDDTDVYGFIGITNALMPLDGTAETNNHIGFFIQGVVGQVSKIYATNGNGTTQTITDTGTRISSPAVILRFEKNGESQIKFYRNDVLIATHTTNIAGAFSGYVIDIGVGINSTGESAYMKIGNNYQLVSDYQ